MTAWLLLGGLLCGSAGGQDLRVSGNQRGLWLVRFAGPQQTYDVALRPAGLPWRSVARDQPGTVAAAVAVGEQLHVLLTAPRDYLIYPADGREPTVGLNPQDPRWGEDARLLGAFEAAGFGGDPGASLVALVARRPAIGPASRPATATAVTATGPASVQAASSQSASEESRTQEALVPAPRGPGRIGSSWTLAFFQFTGGQWAFRTERTIRLAPGQHVLGAAVEGKLYLLAPGGPPAPSALMQWDGSQWHDLAGPPDVPEARILAMLGLAGRLAVVRAVPAADGAWGLQIVYADPSPEQWRVQPVTALGEPLTWPASDPSRDLPMATRLDEMLALVWKKDSALRLGLADRNGQFVDMGPITVLEEQPPSQTGQDVQTYFLMAALGLTIVLMLRRRPKGQPKPFALPPGMVPADLPKRVLAWLADLAPVMVVMSQFFPVHPASAAQVWEWFRSPPNNLIYASMASLGIYVVYGTLMEFRFGATLGKRLLKLRVVGEGGRGPSLPQAAIRNVLKIVELSWPPVLPLLLLVPLLNRTRQRLGDVFARTAVIDAARSAAPPDPSAPPDGQDSPPPPAGP